MTAYTLPEFDQVVHATDVDAAVLVAVYGTVRTGGALDGWLGRDGWGTTRHTVGMGYLPGVALHMHPQGGWYPVVAPNPTGRTRVEVLATSNPSEAAAFVEMETGAGYTADVALVALDDGRVARCIVCMWDRPVGERIPGDDWWMIDPRVRDSAELGNVHARPFDPTEQDPT